MATALGYPTRIIEPIDRLSAVGTPAITTPPAVTVRPAPAPAVVGAVTDAPTAALPINRITDPILPSGVPPTAAEAAVSAAVAAARAVPGVELPPAALGGLSRASEAGGNPGGSSGFAGFLSSLFGKGGGAIADDSTPEGYSSLTPGGSAAAAPDAADGGASAPAAAVSKGTATAAIGGAVIGALAFGPVGLAVAIPILMLGKKA